VVTANGLLGSVANPTATPAITLSTNINGIVKGNGTSLLSANVITNANVVHNVTYIATNTAFNQNFSTTATDIKMNGTQSLCSLAILPRA